MKLRHVEIEQVGAHRHLVLPDIGNGLTVLYGPNETGKSTILASLRGLLFSKAEMAEGRPAIVSDSRVTAMLEAADGAIWRLERGLSTRKTKPTLISPAGARLTGDEAVKDAFPELRMVESSLYKSVFTFQLAELRDLEGETGVADKLYAVGSPSGLTPYELERRLADAAKAIYSRDGRARNAELLQKSREVASLREQLEAIEDTPAAYMRKRDELERAEAARSRLEQQLHVAAEERRTAQVLLDVWPHYRHLAEWEAQSGVDASVNPPWLTLHGTLTATAAEAQGVGLQIEQMVGAARESADLREQASTIRAELCPLWTTPREDGQMPLETASVDPSATGQAHAYALRIEQCHRDVDGLANTVATEQERAKRRLTELQAQGGTGDETAAQWASERGRLAALQSRLQDDVETTTRAESLWDVCESRHNDLMAMRYAVDRAAGTHGMVQGQRRRWGAGIAILAGALFGAYLWHAGQPAAAALALLLGFATAGSWLWRGVVHVPDGDLSSTGSVDVARLEASVAAQWQAVTDALAGLQTVSLDAVAGSQTNYAFRDRVPDDHVAVRRVFQGLRETLRRERLVLEEQQTATAARQRAWTDWQDAMRQLADDEAKCEAAKAELGHVEAAWQNELNSLGVPGSLAPSVFVAEAARVGQLRRTAAQAAKRNSQALVASSTVSEFLERTTALLEQVHKDVPDGALVTPSFGSVHRQMNAARGVDERGLTDDETAVAQERRAVHASDLSATTDENDALSTVRRLESEYHTLLPLLEAARGRLEEWEAARRAARESYVQAVAIAGSEGRFDDLLPELADLTEEDLQVRLRAASERVDALRQTVAQQSRAVWEIEQELKQWPDRQAATDAAWQLAQASAERVQLARQWSVYAVGGALVKEARQRYERVRQPSALQAAGDVFSRVTKRRYVELRATATVDAKNGVAVPLLVTVDGQGQAWPVEQLSRGAREQVYLALRLALLLDYAARGVVLPVVLDDPLVNFDRARFDAVFAILREEAQAGQFFYLTCHDDVAALAVDVGVPVVDLTRATQKE